MVAGPAAQDQFVPLEVAQATLPVGLKQMAPRGLESSVTVEGEGGAEPGSAATFATLKTQAAAGRSAR